MPQKKGRAKSSMLNGLRGGSQPNLISAEKIQEIEDFGFTFLDYVREGGNSITADKRARQVEAMLDEGSFIVNNLADGTPGDHTRLMMEVEPNNIPGKMAMKVARKLRRTFPYLKLGKATFLSSLEHGHDQLPHIDVSNPTETLRGYIEKKMIPLSVMMTYREPAVLNVWRGSHEVVWRLDTSNSNKKWYGERLTIPPYSVLVFRQDLVHAGTAYNSQNLRLHFFMDLNVDDYSDDSGSIKWMDKDFFVMK